MDAPPERPWTEHERVWLLAEIIKAHNVPSRVLFGIVKDTGIRPKWMEIIPPPSRSLQSCQRAFDEFHFTDSTTSSDPPILPAMYAPSPILQRNIPYAPESSTGFPGRTIQPRPPNLASMQHMGGSPYTPSPVDEPTRKKRGRPTKVEIEHRREAAAARGEVYPPPRPAKVAKITAGRSSIGLTDILARHSPTGAAPVGLPTAEREASEDLSTGNGKRKRGRIDRTDSAARRYSDISEMRSHSPTEVKTLGDVHRAEEGTAVQFTAVRQYTGSSEDPDTSMAGTRVDNGSHGEATAT